MLKEEIGSGTTIEEARAAAIALLNAPEDANVTTEVIDIPVKKTLGLFGGNLAKVKAFYEEVEQSKAETFIRTILNGMGIKEVEIKVEETESDIHIQLNCGDDTNLVIGRRGETLDAIQYLTRLNISKKNEDYKRVLINVGNYREKRENTLRDMARKNAERVRKYGKKVFLDPMNPYERRIIHTTIQDIDGINSHSVGSDSDRRVVISSAEKSHTPTTNHAPKNDFKSSSNNTVNSSVKAPAPSATGSASRKPKSDASSASLYEKIEPKKN